MSGSMIRWSAMHGIRFGSWGRRRGCWLRRGWRWLPESGPTALAAGIAAALYYEDENDPSACELKHLREKNGIPAVLREICGLEEGCELEKLILEQVQNLFCQDKKMTE